MRVQKLYVVLGFLAQLGGGECANVSETVSDTLKAYVETQHRTYRITMENLGRYFENESFGVPPEHKHFFTKLFRNAGTINWQFRNEEFTLGTLVWEEIIAEVFRHYVTAKDQDLGIKRKECLISSLNIPLFKGTASHMAKKSDFEGIERLENLLEKYHFCFPKEHLNPLEEKRLAIVNEARFGKTGDEVGRFSIDRNFLTKLVRSIPEEFLEVLPPGAVLSNLARFLKWEMEESKKIDAFPLIVVKDIRNFDQFVENSLITDFNCRESFFNTVSAKFLNNGVDILDEDKLKKLVKLGADHICNLAVAASKDPLAFNKFVMALHFPKLVDIVDRWDTDEYWREVYDRLKFDSAVAELYLSGKLHKNFGEGLIEYLSKCSFALPKSLPERMFHLAGEAYPPISEELKALIIDILGIKPSGDFVSWDRTKAD